MLWNKILPLIFSELIFQICEHCTVYILQNLMPPEVKTPLFFGFIWPCKCQFYTIMLSTDDWMFKYWVHIRPCFYISEWVMSVCCRVKSIDGWWLCEHHSGSSAPAVLWGEGVPSKRLDTICSSAVCDHLAFLCNKGAYEHVEYYMFQNCNTSVICIMYSFQKNVCFISMTWFLLTCILFICCLSHSAPLYFLFPSSLNM